MAAIGLTHEELLDTIELANTAMDHMGDALNELDVVEPKDTEITGPAFAAVRDALEKNGRAAAPAENTNAPSEAPTTEAPEAPSEAAIVDPAPASDAPAETPAEQ